MPRPTSRISARPSRLLRNVPTTSAPPAAALAASRWRLPDPLLAGAVLVVAVPEALPPAPAKSSLVGRPCLAGVDVSSASSWAASIRAASSSRALSLSIRVPYLA